MDEDEVVVVVEEEEAGLPGEPEADSPGPVHDAGGRLVHRRDRGRQTSASTPEGGGGGVAGADERAKAQAKA